VRPRINLGPRTATNSSCELRRLSGRRLISCFGNHSKKYVETPTNKDNPANGGSVVDNKSVRHDRRCSQQTKENQKGLTTRRFSSPTRHFTRHPNDRYAASRSDIRTRYNPQQRVSSLGTWWKQNNLLERHAPPKRNKAMFPKRAPTWSGMDLAATCQASGRAELDRMPGAAGVARSIPPESFRDA
jgi:hypothetical protein